MAEQTFTVLRFLADGALNDTEPAPVRRVRGNTIAPDAVVEIDINGEWQRFVVIRIHHSTLHVRPA